MASFKDVFSYMAKKYGTSTEHMNDMNDMNDSEELNLPNPVPNLPALPTFISTPVVYDDNPRRVDLKDGY